MDLEVAGVRPGVVPLPATPRASEMVLDDLDNELGEKERFLSPGDCEAMIDLRRGVKFRLPALREDVEPNDLSSEASSDGPGAD